MITKENRQKIRKISGSGFVEVLLSLLIISLGALGMVALHNRSLQYNQVAYYHSQAIILATDMLDRLHINRTQALITDIYRTSIGDAIYDSCDDGSYPDNCELGQCSTEQLARYDVSQWKFYLLCHLPNAMGSIDYKDGVYGRTYTITVSFENNSNAALKSMNVVLKATL
ncbi:MAG: type IV pilus modification protein PilV [Endozoicomonas sp. (ex Botrylloides leachii)]|nr:type IV pilus modification protein PilV [Endozoicomonas sp. (ex Botrylloides leachii)]